MVVGGAYARDKIPLQDFALKMQGGVFAGHSSKYALNEGNLTNQDKVPRMFVLEDSTAIIPNRGNLLIV